MKCDFCGKEHAAADMSGVPHHLVFRLAKTGFVPAGFVVMVRTLNLAPGQDPGSYFRDVVSKSEYGQDDIWTLCGSCLSETQDYGQEYLRSLGRQLKIDEMAEISPEGLLIRKNDD